MYKSLLFALIFIFHVLTCAQQKTQKLPPEQEGMILVEGGSFWMGCNDNDDDEKPVHKVTVNSFYIDKFEVTQKEFNAVMGYNPSSFNCQECPVENVTWQEAKDYAKKVGKRLPTEAEWEYSARGGRKSKGYEFAGSQEIAEVGWYDPRSKDMTHKVGLLKPNELGIYDMSGNVWEYCSDWYNESYYKKSPKKNPRGPIKGAAVVVRGGSWISIFPNCKVHNRSFAWPENKNNDTGFRCVKDIK